VGAGRKQRRKARDRSPEPDRTNRHSQNHKATRDNVSTADRQRNLSQCRKRRRGIGTPHPGGTDCHAGAGRLDVNGERLDGFS
jgi:hypothetical protein